MSAMVLQFLKGPVKTDVDGDTGGAAFFSGAGEDGGDEVLGSNGVNWDGRVAVLDRVPPGKSDISSAVSISSGLYVGMEGYSRKSPKLLTVVRIPFHTQVETDSGGGSGGGSSGGGTGATGGAGSGSCCRSFQVFLLARIGRPAAVVGTGGVGGRSGSGEGCGEFPD